MINAWRGRATPRARGRQVCPSGGAASGGRSSRLPTLSAAMGSQRSGSSRINFLRTQRRRFLMWVVARNSRTIDCSEMNHPRDGRAFAFDETTPQGNVQALGPPWHGLRPTGVYGFWSMQRKRRGPLCLTAVRRARRSSSPEWSTSVSGKLLTDVKGVCLL